MQNKNRIKEIKRLYELKNKINELITLLIQTNYKTTDYMNYELNKLFNQLVKTRHKIRERIIEKRDVYIEINTIDDLLKIL